MILHFIFIRNAVKEINYMISSRVDSPENFVFRDKFEFFFIFYRPAQGLPNI